MIQSIQWLHNSVRFLDQTLLPLEEHYVETSNINTIADAILQLKVRGAPLIGIAAAYGIVLGIQPFRQSSKEEFLNAFEQSVTLLSKTRPTAKNLFWALERMQNVVRLYQHEHTQTLFEKLEKEAIAIHAEDRTMCEMMGKYAASLIPEGANILTHCNAGALATGGIGTALGAIMTAHIAGKKITVFADETRPLLQGARLTMWELLKAGIPSVLITDNSAAWTIISKNVNLIIVGADRIAANGDTANKIGTYNLAILAKEHAIPFYVVAPTSTVDLSISSGKEITVEERSKDEVTKGFGKQTAPASVDVFSPAFDVTPHTYITAIITEKGIHQPQFQHSLQGIRSV